MSALISTKYSCIYSNLFNPYSYYIESLEFKEESMNSNFVAVILLGLLAVGCGSDSPSDVTSGDVASNSVSGSATAVTSQVEELSTLSPAEAKSNQFALMANEWWSDNSLGLNDDRSDTPTTVNGRTFMRIELDPKAERENGSSINVFGRLDDTLKVMCVVGEGLPASAISGNYPIAGDYTLSFTTASIARVKRICGDINLPDGFKVGLNVEEVTTGLYDRRLNICLGQDSCTAGTAGFVQLYRNNASVINIAAGESSVESGKTYHSRTMVALNKSTKELKVEYVSTSDDAGTATYVHRLYKNGNQGMIVSAIASDQNVLSYVVKGNLTTPSELASIAIQNEPLGTVAPLTACFRPSTGAISTCTVDADTSYANGNALVGIKGAAASAYSQVGPNSSFTFTGFSDAKTAFMSSN
jgi:hypothetical protein